MRYFHTRWQFTEETAVYGLYTCLYFSSVEAILHTKPRFIEKLLQFENRCTYMYVRGTGNNSNLHAAQLPTYMYAVVEVGACGVDISGTCLRTYE